MLDYDLKRPAVFGGLLNITIVFLSYTLVKYLNEYTQLLF